MFDFTVILILTFSVIMLIFVFQGFYHKIIATLLCLYNFFRFASLGLSNPGLAIEVVVDENIEDLTESNN